MFQLLLVSLLALPASYCRLSVLEPFACFFVLVGIIQVRVRSIFINNIVLQILLLLASEFGNVNSLNRPRFFEFFVIFKLDMLIGLRVASLWLATIENGQNDILHLRLSFGFSATFLFVALLG